MEWIGTPYRHMTNMKGRGADCTLFIAATMKNAGFLTDIIFKEYSRDWHLHENNNVVMESYAEGANNLLPGLLMQNIEGCANSYMRGDVFLMSVVPSGVIHHAGICIDQNTMIHCIQPRGVQLSPFRGWWKRHVKQIVRIITKDAE
jgi:cell wall-associated NlpC family hydrolase